MVEQGGGGGAMNVTSRLAEISAPYRTAWLASKGGARMLTSGQSARRLSGGAT